MTPLLSDLTARLNRCRGVLVDSNVFLDVSTQDSVWGEWSARTLSELAEHTILVINPVIYAEISIAYPMIEELDAVVPAAIYRRDPLPWEAAFLAGKCFLQYRRRGGQRRSPLPDFYIGAHAAVERLGLLTRDSARYRSYFPGITLFSPETPPIRK
jgi:predicted nucleic acid-binding protein